jgi:nucleoside-diphosphate-sugar epimerase
VAKSALILGGTGQVGYASAAALTAAGWDVTAAHRGRRKPPPGLQAATVTLDREDTAALTEAADGFDLVVDTLAFTPEDARHLVRLDVGALVVISTAAVYIGANGSYLDVAHDAASFPHYPVPIEEDWPTIDNQEQTYSPLKAAMERVLLAGPLPVTVLRAGAIHGPFSSALREWYFIKRALDRRDRVILAWDGLARFHPAATANIAALVAASAAAPGNHVLDAGNHVFDAGNHILNAGDDECPTEAQICRTIFDAMGHDAEILTFPGPPRGTVGLTPWGVAKPFVLSMERASREVGYHPAVSYPEAVAMDIEWAVRTVAEADVPAEEWRHIFPGVLGFGADRWFDYEAEDGYRH